MPTISMFYGIIVSMYVNDHNPPHIHTSYQEFHAIYSLTGQRLEGEMPIRQDKLILAWIEIHKEELEADWILASENKAVYKIEPLK